MLRNTTHYPRLTGATDADAAGSFRVYAGQAKRLDDSLLARHRHPLP